MNVAISEVAGKELDEAFEYYEAELEGLGEQFIYEFIVGVQKIKSYPKAWPEYSKQTRKYLLNRFPYGVLYHLKKNEIIIIAIMHLHRDPVKWEARAR